MSVTEKRVYIYIYMCMCGDETEAGNVQETVSSASAQHLSRQEESRATVGNQKGSTHQDKRGEH